MCTYVYHLTVSWLIKIYLLYWNEIMITKPNCEIWLCVLIIEKQVVFQNMELSYIMEFILEYNYYLKLALKNINNILWFFFISVYFWLKFLKNFANNNIIILYNHIKGSKQWFQKFLVTRIYIYFYIVLEQMLQCVLEPINSNISHCSNPIFPSNHSTVHFHLNHLWNGSPGSSNTTTC